MSRRHAQLLVTDTQVRLTDLGSRHGTLVNGERVRAFRHLLAGDVITVGRVTLVFHRDVQPSATRPFLESGQLRQRLEEEIDRALHYQRQTSLVVIDLAPGMPGAAPPPDEPVTVPDGKLRRRRPSRPTGEIAVPGPASGVPLSPIDRGELAGALAGQVRLIDAAGFVDAGRLAVIMPELDRDAARAAAERMLESLGGVDFRARAGVATCPDDGCDADTLLSSGRAGAEAAKDGRCVAADSAATTITIGGNAIVVADPAMRRVYELIGKLAKSDLPILVQGATGTGKEIAATAIHELSDRKDNQLVAINCAALPEHLVESELFGHEKGAFTGAGSAKQGLLERASGGTVFLDELGELPAAVQAKLLRAIETQRILRVGDVKERKIDVRLVAATNRDLHKEIAEGRFREDLFFRLSAARIVLPPLKDRTREIAHLARVLLAAACARMQRKPLRIAPVVMQKLFAHHWPGNVRELKNAMDYAAATAPLDDVEDSEVELWHLPPEIADPRVAGEPGGASGDSPGDGHRRASDRTEGRAENRASGDASDGGPRRDGPGDAGGPAGSHSEATKAPREFRPIADEVRELERLRMVQALEAAGGQQNKAAELISMPLRTFVTKLKRYDIQSARTRGKR